MTDPKETSPKHKVRSREPKKATAAGIFDNLRKLPHPVEEILGLTVLGAQSSLTHPNPSQPIPSHPNLSQPIPSHPNPIPKEEQQVNREAAPRRDFNRRANSLERDALPSGLFPGTSKKLYDALYLRTHGAVVPTRTLKATKRELIAWSGIRSKNTIAVNLQILMANGLVKRTLEIGDHEGSIYEIQLPEELGIQPDPTQPIPTQPNPTQKLGGDPTQLLGWVGLGNRVENKGTYGDPKTSFKTLSENDDDEAFAGLIAKLRQAAKEVTGRESTSAENARWADVGELLAAELRLAAARTTVSSAPAFLAAHLARRLRKRDAGQIEREVREASAGATDEVSAAPKLRLDAVQLQEQVNLMAELLHDGRTLESLDSQFAASFRPAQWHMIRSMALAQAKALPQREQGGSK
ncbi:MAG: hypothetical protein ACR2LZ_08900 [Pyrinomonadaceae bacterium]